MGTALSGTFSVAATMHMCFGIGKFSHMKVHPGASNQFVAELIYTVSSVLMARNQSGCAAPIFVMPSPSSSVVKHLAVTPEKDLKY